MAKDWTQDETIRMLEKEIERLREMLDDAETIGLAHYVMLKSTGHNEQASHVRMMVNKISAALKEKE